MSFYLVVPVKDCGERNTLLENRPLDVNEPVCNYQPLDVHLHTDHFLNNT